MGFRVKVGGRIGLGWGRVLGLVRIRLGLG